MSRFFAEKYNVGDSTIVIDRRDDIHHIKNVLRLKEGDEIEISDSETWEYRTEIIRISDSEVEVKILDKQTFAREPNLKVTLFQGVPKQGKMETIVQKCVELGVFQIVPVFMDRSVIVNNGNYWKKIVRYRKVADEAAKQCRRGVLPEISHEIDFKLLINNIVKYELVLFPYENENKRTIKGCLRNLQRTPKSVAIIIGPEGGFSDSEATTLKQVGAECVSLGKTILRTETAGMTALTMTMYELEL